MSTATILVVEDNPISRKMMRVALQSDGYAVLEAPDGATAISLTERESPDLVLEDLGLPDQDGLELVQKLHRIPGCEKLPVIAVSGFVEKLQTAAKEVGFADVLPKPVDPSHLLQLVESFLGARRRSKRPGSGRRVLVVDDDTTERKLMCVLLRSLGFEVLSAQDGAEAIELARNDPPDAIVSDIRMPRIDGYSLCMTLRSQERLQRIPILLVSSTCTGESDRSMAKAVGASDFAVRTGDSTNLREVLRNFLSTCQDEAPSEPADSGQVESERRVAFLEAGLGVLTGVAEHLHEVESAEAILEEVFPHCLDAAGLSRGAVYLYQEGQHQLACRCGYGTFEVPKHPPEALEAVCRQHRLATVPRSGGGLTVLSPMFVGKQCVGVLALEAPSTDLQRYWLTFARALAVQLAQVVELTRSMIRATESQARFCRLVEAVHEVFWIRDPQFRKLLYISPAYDKVVGRPYQELYRNPLEWIEAVHPEDQERVKATLLDEAAKPRDIEFEFRIVRPDGVVRAIRAREYPIQDKAGKITQIAGIAEDVTEQKEIQAQLSQSQKMDSLGRLAGGVAHDFNSLLAAILGFCELGIIKAPAGEPLRRYLEEIEKAGRRGHALTQQLLEFSRKQVTEPKVLDFNLVVRGMDQLIAQFAGGEIRVVMNLDPKICRVRADLDQLGRLIMNLVTNARDAIGRSGTITVETSNVELEGRPMVLFSVSDTGHGMSDETQRRLFEPFFTTKGRGAGTGLGLATVYGIVQQSGGRILVDSKEGKGSRFRVYFPRVEDEVEARPAAVRPSQTPHGSETILVVDDDPSALSWTVEALQSLGYTVLSAAGPEEAIELSVKHSGTIDAMLTDLVMVGKNGVELARDMQALQGGLRVLFMSGFTGDSDVARHLVTDKMTFLQKPFTTETLATKLREVLDGRSHPGRR